MIERVFDRFVPNHERRAAIAQAARSSHLPASIPTEAPEGLLLVVVVCAAGAVELELPDADGAAVGKTVSAAAEEDVVFTVAVVFV